jgi:hypothetical protein
MVENAELLDALVLDNVIRRKIALHGALYRAESGGAHAC